MTRRDTELALAEAMEKLPDVTIPYQDLDDLLHIANLAALLVEALTTKGRKPTDARRELADALDRFNE